MPAAQDKYTQINKKQEVYSDFLMNFTPHPFTHDLARVKNEDAVKRSIRNLILTNAFEVPFQPTLGGNINRFLFEPIDITTQKSIEESIVLTIKNHEPRARLLELYVVPDEINQKYDVAIIFNVVNNPGQVEMVLELYRIR